MAATETSARAAAELDELYRRHVGDVYRYTYAVLGNHADAEDVTQTTFVNALRALERGESPRAASTWLIAIAQNVVRQRWRQASSRPAEVELVHDVPETPPDDDIELDELVRALQRIPPAQREALVLRELEGRPYNEIAELLGLTTSALETLLFRARRSLAEELEALVTCQTAELAISKQLDGRLGRKERRRLDEHLAECEDCARLAATAKRQRRAFKGLAVLPLPVGLALFKGAPSASAAASLPTIGLGAASGTNGVGSAGVGATGASGATGATTIAAGTAVGGSFVAIAAKVAAVIIAGTVATGVGYKGLQAVVGDPAPAGKQRGTPATQKGASARTDAKSAGKGRGDATTGPGSQSTAATSSAVAAVAGVSAGSSGDASTGSASPGHPTTPVAGGGGPGAAAPSSGSADAPNTFAPTAPNATQPKAPKKAKAKTPTAAPKPKPKPTPAPPQAAPTPPAQSPTPPPTGPGASNGGGVPSNQGEPADPGKPADTGKPEETSNPSDTGRPADTGKPSDGGNGGANGTPSDPAPSSSSSSTPSSLTPAASTTAAPLTGSPAGQGSTSGTTTSSSAAASADTSTSTGASTNGCPGGGNGPGNGTGCGVGNANGQNK